MLSASQGKHQTTFNAPPPQQNGKKVCYPLQYPFFSSLFSLVSNLFASPFLQTERGEGKKEFSSNPISLPYTHTYTHTAHTQHTHSTHKAHSTKR